MRKFINIISEAQALRPMIPQDYSGTEIIQRHGEMSIQGAHRENMSAKEAKAYLDSHPDGTLGHDMFETDSFVTLDKNGTYIFYHGLDDKIDLWDWDTDLAALKDWDDDQNPLVGWWYNPGEEMEMTNGGIEWWDKVRNGDFTPRAQERLENMNEDNDNEFELVTDEESGQISTRFGNYMFTKSARGEFGILKQGPSRGRAFWISPDAAKAFATFITRYS